MSYITEQNQPPGWYPESTGEGGGGTSITVEPLFVTENGTYTAPSGTAYSPVSVNVPIPGYKIVEGQLTPASDATVLSLPCGDITKCIYASFVVDDYEDYVSAEHNGMAVGAYASSIKPFMPGATAAQMEHVLSFAVYQGVVDWFGVLSYPTITNGYLNFTLKSTVTVKAGVPINYRIMGL